MKKQFLWTGWWSLMIIILFFTACTTGPKINTRQDWYALLPERATAHLVLHLSPATKGLVKNLASMMLPALSKTNSTDTVMSLNLNTWLDPLLARTDEAALAFERTGTPTVTPASIEPQATASPTDEVSVAEPVHADAATPEPTGTGANPDTNQDSNLADKPFLIYGLLEGSFPKYFIDASLRNNKDWREVKGLYPYWESLVYGIQVFIIDNSTILFSNGRIDALLKRYHDFPQVSKTDNVLLRKVKERKTEQTKKAAINITPVNPNAAPEYAKQQAEERFVKDELLFNIPAFNGQSLLQDLPQKAGVSLPLKQVLISADRKDKDYQFQATLEFLEAPNLQDTSNLLKLSLLYLLRKGEIPGFASRLKPLAIKQEANYIHVDGFKLTSGELEKIIYNLIGSKFIKEKTDEEQNMRN